MQRFVQVTRRARTVPAHTASSYQDPAFRNLIAKSWALVAGFGAGTPGRRTNYAGDGRNIRIRVSIHSRLKMPPNIAA